MQNDLIQRAEALRVLEGLRASVGDVFFMAILDKAIALIQEVPAAETAVVELLPDRIRLIYPGGIVQEVVQ